ncbi:MAG: hypothetical protein ACI8SA_001013 [Dokdonia sp.]|jgi:hypothetical protein
MEIVILTKIMAMNPLNKEDISSLGSSKLKRNRKEVIIENAIIVKSIEKMIHFGALDSKFKYVFKPEF